MLAEELKPSVTVTGPLFPEPVQIIVVLPMGASVELIVKATPSNTVCECILNTDRLSLLSVYPAEEFVGGMKIGDRDTPGTRFFAEREFRQSVQVLVATEAAGEGINLQLCWLMINYDIPWNPVRLEQRMGRIHRYGQEKNCLIFHFVSTNTREGRVLQKLFERIEAIQDDLDPQRTGKIFNVLGEAKERRLVPEVIKDFFLGSANLTGLSPRVAKDKIDGLNYRLENRRRELEQERRCSVADIPPIGRAWVLPHLERSAPGIAPTVSARHRADCRQGSDRARSRATLGQRLLAIRGSSTARPTRPTSTSWAIRRRSNGSRSNCIKNGLRMRSNGPETTR